MSTNKPGRRKRKRRPRSCLAELVATPSGCRAEHLRHWATLRCSGRHLGYAVKMERRVPLCLHALPSLVRGRDGNPIMSHVELGPTNSETHLRNWVQVLMSCKAIWGPGSLQRICLMRKSWFESEVCKQLNSNDFVAPRRRGPIVRPVSLEERCRGWAIKQRDGAGLCVGSSCLPVKRPSKNP